MPSATSRTITRSASSIQIALAAFTILAAMAFWWVSHLPHAHAQGAGTDMGKDSSAQAAPLRAGVPRPDHVVIAVEENHGYSEIIGSPSAPYINSLAAQGALFTNSHGVEHPSQPNYLDLFSGSNQAVIGDNCPNTYSTDNLGAQLISAGLTFSGYSEDLPAPGSTVCTSGAYARKHSPWINFTNVPPSSNLPFTYFPTDYSTLPTISFVIPNLDNDMHDGTIAQGDSWLQTHLSGYVNWARTHNSLFIMTFDEDDYTSVNQVATIFTGTMVVPGQYSENINHFNVLRTLEDMYDLPYAGLSGNFQPVTDVWASTVTATATSTPVGTVQPTATATPACITSALTSSPNNGSSLNYLYGLSASGLSDVWAVGAFYNGSSLRTLTERWNGSIWNISSSPNNGGENNSLLAISALDSSNAWAAGYSTSISGTIRTLIERWDGTAWSIVPSPGGTGDSRLNGIAARAANDVWAVGYFAGTNGVPRTLIEHWNGSAWAVVPSPNGGPGPNYLNAVSSVGAGEVWAAGSFEDSNGATRTLIERWNGAAWSIVPTPNAGLSNNALSGVSAFLSGDVWAVGHYTIVSGSTITLQTLTEHWDGVAWTVVPSLNSGSGSNVLNAVSAAGPSDVWAVGSYLTSGGMGNASQPLVTHWNGSAWSIAASPSSGSNDNYLYGVAAQPGSALAGGFYNDANSVSRTLAIADTSACSTPSPSATNTATATPLSGSYLVAHVMWQGRPVQPNALQQLPVTLTLKSAAGEYNYTSMTTDAGGYFTVSTGSLLTGVYNWRVKGPKYLANSGIVTILPGRNTQEMGLMRAGDANSDNTVNAVDFNILRSSFGKACGDVGYDDRADFTGDCRVSSPDFVLLKGNYGTAGAQPLVSR